MFFVMLGGRLEDLREHQFRSRLLLILAVVLLYLAFVIAGEPVDAVGIAQFGNGLGKHKNDRGYYLRLRKRKE